MDGGGPPRLGAGHGEHDEAGRVCRRTPERHPEETRRGDRVEEPSRDTLRLTVVVEVVADDDEVAGAVARHGVVGTNGSNESLPDGAEVRRFIAEHRGIDVEDAEQTAPPLRMGETHLDPIQQEHGSGKPRGPIQQLAPEADAVAEVGRHER
jgi:hypothetical protein